MFFVCGRLPLYYLIETIEKDTINILCDQIAGLCIAEESERGPRAAWPYEGRQPALRTLYTTEGYVVRLRFPQGYS